MIVRHKIDHLCTVKSCSDSDKSSLPPPLMGLSCEILVIISEQSHPKADVYYAPIQRTDGARVGDLLAACDAIIQRVEVLPGRQLRREKVE